MGVNQTSKIQADSLRRVKTTKAGQAPLAMCHYGKGGL